MNQLNKYFVINASTKSTNPSYIKHVPAGNGLELHRISSRLWDFASLKYVVPVNYKPNKMNKKSNAKKKDNNSNKNQLSPM